MSSIWKRQFSLLRPPVVWLLLFGLAMRIVGEGKSAQPSGPCPGPGRKAAEVGLLAAAGGHLW